MKRSLRTKLTILLFCMTAGIIVISLCFNAFFLEFYYLKTKEQAILTVYEELLLAVKSVDGEEETEETTDSSSSDFATPDIESDLDVPYFHDKEDSKQFQSSILNDSWVENISYLCDRKGVSVYAIDRSGSPVYIYGSVNMLYQRLSMMLVPVPRKEKTELIRQDANYVLQIVTEKGNSYEQRYLELYGIMDENVFVLMRVAMESIEESAAISNDFYLQVALILMVICLTVLWFVSKRFTMPILALASLSEKMCELNFDVRYDGNREDEIGILGNSMNQLSDTLARTISELKAANYELQSDIKRKEEIDTMRTDFLSNVSHELKTPIALIQGYAEGLKDCVNEDSESRDFYCEVIIDEANKMNRMVKKLLTLNQIEFGTTPATFERFSITQLIDGILHSVQILLKQDDIKVYFDTAKDYYVWSDEYQMEEVLTNYISNAIHHCQGEKVIRIWIEEKDTSLRVFVFNSGMPIPEEELDHIWEKFYKVDKARTREYGGNGIGLSIVKAIMDSFGQSYGVYNEAKGVTFWFDVDRVCRKAETQ